VEVLKNGASVSTADARSFLLGVRNSGAGSVRPRPPCRSYDGTPVGYIIMLVGSFLGPPMPVIHVMGGVFRGEIAKVQRSLLVRPDASRARRDCDVFRHPLGARTVGACNGASPVVEEPQPDASPSRGAADRLHRSKGE
jgi:hypothetical protein